MRNYSNAGGRVFATHYDYTWFRNGPSEFRSLAFWPATPGALDINDDVPLDTSFPKGQALVDWLRAVEPTAVNAQNQVLMSDLKASVVDVAGDGRATRWIYYNNANTGLTEAKYFSFNTPVGDPVDKQCGRAVFSDIHVGSTRRDDRLIPVSRESGKMTAHEKALEFLLFDLASCISDDNKPPEIPR